METIRLGGEWELRQAGKRDPIKADVPGTVHTDLLAAGKIPDPYYRDNESRLQWIGEKDWVYRRSFDVSDEFIRHDRIVLHCDGLDTLATIEINSHEIARTDNMFRTYEFDVKSRLKCGRNNIEIRFKSTLPYIRKREKQRHLPAWKGVHDVKGGNWVRKEQCNYGWDWGPVLVTCGIWKSIELVAFDTARLGDILIKQKHYSYDVVLDVTASIEKVRKNARLNATFYATFDGRPTVEAKAPIRSGKAHAKLTLRDPVLWWPRGMGGQWLYEVTVVLTDNNGEDVDYQIKRIGLRTLRLVRRKDRWGESFHFSANGVPFFAKGADWIPADTFATQLNWGDYRRLIDDAATANMNMLRVWGGGIYENEFFYNLCDQAGICVWQDFMFACAAYPGFDQAFLENVRREAEDNIRRLRHHPCIALWCGNNELEQGLVNDKWNDTQMSWADYSTIFDKLLPEVVTREDPDRDYWPCSPHSPIGDRTDFNNPQWGDAHLWRVWHGRQPFEWYRTAMHRFVSEFGFQSFPHPKTIEEFTLPEDRNVSSYIMELHQRSNIGNSAIMSYMLDWFRLPKDFEMTVWLSQILQGMAMKYAVEHWRRNMPRCMGALYWQLNDCWPAVSWSSIDSRHRWKALQYMAKRFYSPVLVSAVEDPVKNRVALYVSSDELQYIRGNIAWKVTNVKGIVFLQGNRDIVVPPGKSTLLRTIDIGKYLKENGPRDVMFWTELTSDRGVTSRDYTAFARPKHLELQKPDIKTKVTKNIEGNPVISLVTDVPALWIWLDIEGIDARFSDNFFHLLPGEEINVEVLEAEDLPIRYVNAHLKVRSLVDTYK
jgi:beta-mannosidase